MAPPSVIYEWATSTGSVIIAGPLDVDEILFQSLGSSGYIVRYTFNGSPSLAGVLVGHYLIIENATNDVNNGKFRVVNIDDTAKYIEVINNARPDNTLDEASDSPATGSVEDDGAPLNNIPISKQQHGFVSPEKPPDGIFNSLFKVCFDWINFLRGISITTVADVTALKAVDTTLLSADSLVFVENWGLYTLKKSNSQVEDLTYIVEPTTLSADKWFLIVPAFNHLLSIFIEKNSVLQDQINEINANISNDQQTTPETVQQIIGPIRTFVIDANINNFNPTDFDTTNFLRLDVQGPASGRNITGFQAPPAGVNRIVRGVNVGVTDLNFIHQSTASAVGNRFLLGGDADKTIALHEAFAFYYDHQEQRWIEYIAI